MTFHHTVSKILKIVVIKISDYILNAIECKKITILVLLDLSKAFDRINHYLLLGKRERIDASPSAIRWFKSYLSGRQQAVRIGSTLSSTLPINHGVPQGSILGPVLFSLYINDLPTVSKHCDIECYVDDSKQFLSFSLSELDNAVAKVNQDLKLMFKWCCANYLLINSTFITITSCNFHSDGERIKTICYCNRSWHYVGYTADL